MFELTLFLMKKLYFILMLVAVMSLTACEFKLWPESDDSSSDYDDVDAEVESYVSVEGGFSVDFPGEPFLEVDPIETDYGLIDMYFYMYEESLYKAYMVAYADYPDQVIEDKGTDMVLEDAAYGMTEGMTVDYYEDLAQTAYPGKSISANDGVNYMDVDLYVVGNRLYQIAIIDSYGYATDGLEFLASFELL